MPGPPRNEPSAEHLQALRAAAGAVQRARERLEREIATRDQAIAQAAAAGASRRAIAQAADVTYARVQQVIDRRRHADD